MSLGILHSFQNQVYELLATKEHLKDLGIYLYVQHDAKYPFVLVSVIKANDFSTLPKSAFEVLFDISIFSRDNKSHFKIASNVDEAIEIQNFALSDYNIISLKKLNISWNRSNDLLTNKLTLSYQSFLRQN